MISNDPDATAQGAAVLLHLGQHLSLASRAPFVLITPVSNQNRDVRPCSGNVEMGGPVFVSEGHRNDLLEQRRVFRASQFGCPPKIENKTLALAL